MGSRRSSNISSNATRSKAESAARGPQPEGAASRLVEDFDFDAFAVLLDIDGTILDLAPTPAGVLVPSRLQSTLTTLWKWTGGALALISGRPLDDIDRVFAPLELPAVGGHGAEIRLAASHGKVIRSHVPLLDERIRRELLTLTARGIFIEDKGYSVAVHYRRAPEMERELHKAIAAIVAGVSGGKLEVLPGKAVIEVKPTGFNKGSAVLELLEHPPFKGRRPIFIGDDVTDEAAFAVLSEVNGIGFSVGRIIPGATGVFAGPAEVRDWLDRIAAKVPN